MECRNFLSGTIGLGGGVLFSLAAVGLGRGQEPFASWFYSFAWWSYILIADCLIFQLKGQSLLGLAAAAGRSFYFWPPAWPAVSYGNSGIIGLKPSGFIISRFSIGGKSSRYRSWVTWAFPLLRWNVR
jgi:hypothetical protein